MRIDAISIFPGYFSALELSLFGKARDKGLIDFHAHDLRSWTEDKHKTVDDSPYGGGAGMVMMPEPWGRALDDVAKSDTQPVVIFTTPAGKPFSQAMAQELSTASHIVFACGRYEGIDQRVVEYAKGFSDVREISIGDYVLNGGEVAAIVMIEAVTRLLPGFMGNAESIVEESHSEGLLEYPSYTKPSEWRGFKVPEVLLSGHHAEIDKWRKEQQVIRTQQNRPDLLS